MSDQEKTPALSPRASRGIALAFAVVIVVFVFTVTVMLAGWAVLWLWGVLFG